jgi:hypothetical protein
VSRDHPYDVSTIQGLITVLNDVIGPNSISPQDRLITAGWSFGGQLVLEFIGNGTQPTIFNYSNASNDITDALTRKGVVFSELIPHQVNNVSSTDPNHTNPAYPKGFMASLPLIPIDL